MPLNPWQDPPSEVEMRCLTRPRLLQLLRLIIHSLSMSLEELLFQIIFVILVGLLWCYRELWAIFCFFPNGSGRGGLPSCKHLDLLVRWHLWKRNYIETDSLFETLYTCYIFYYLFTMFYPFKGGQTKRSSKKKLFFCLRRFFPSKVGGRPAWLGDSSFDVWPTFWSSSFDTTPNYYVNIWVYVYIYIIIYICISSLIHICQGSRGSFGFVWFQKSKKEPQSGSCGVGSSAVRFLAVQETVRFYECDSCATWK